MTGTGILGNLGVGVYIKGGSSVGRSQLLTKFLNFFLAHTFLYVSFFISGPSSGRCGSSHGEGL